ncbi:MAG: lysozyme inhibitor LprI family protein [Planktothrix sp. GU0601_MAG3]|nr:MAG: lysozyme inhibitor LprI family protein [Planktothrix sp. GU0601_MAG3]
MGKLLQVCLPVLIIANFTVFLSPSSATPEILIAQTVKCKPDGNTLEMRKCASDQYQIADQKLNQTYKKLMAQLSPERKKRLIEAQRAWISFRDKTCSFESSQVLGGTAEPLFLTQCLAKVTQQRVQDLQNYLAEIK